jgi:hypothetical protein
MPNITIPKVLFVLGAGSSKSLNFPLGGELKGQLLASLNPNHTVYRALIKSGFIESQVTAFADELDGAEFDTIDEHIREIDDVEIRKIGKRAVAYLIRASENATALRHKDDKVRHWYKTLANHFRRFPDHVSPDQFSFISYNYDRSLPHYLYETLSLRRIPIPKVKAFAGPLNFFHIHGHVGPLPWQVDRGGEDKSYYKYGAVMSEMDLAAHIPDILLPDDERGEGIMAARLAANAQIIAFIGFGFHETNMSLLPFATNAPKVIPNTSLRRYFSINPEAPPKDLLLEGRTVIHLPGSAEDVMEQFFQRLADGKLLADPAPGGRFVSS